MNNSKLITNSWYTPIDKLMLWRGGWVKYDRKISDLCLRVAYDQLFITMDSKILESFNMTCHKIKGIYKDDVIILIVNDKNNEVRKIKFQIKSNITECLAVLGNQFPVVNHNLMQTCPVINSKYRSIDSVLKYALEHRGNVGASNLPAEFESFVKLCVLDPNFPDMVTETEKFVNKHVKNKLNSVFNTDI